MRPKQSLNKYLVTNSIRKLANDDTLQVDGDSVRVTLMRVYRGRRENFQDTRQAAREHCIFILGCVIQQQKHRSKR
jgi:hypothetical protein